MSDTAVIVALVDDLMDRSRISAALASVKFVRTLDDAIAAVSLTPMVAAGGDARVVVIVDLAKHADLLVSLREALPTAWIVGFAPHVDDALHTEAQERINVVLPRSRFFRDVATSVSGC